VTAVYKFGRVYDLETLLSSNSINQLYIRIEYLKRFRNNVRKIWKKSRTNGSFLKPRKSNCKRNSASSRR